jgi:hypothetical protein
MTTIKTIIAELLGDRAVQLGTGTSSLSLFGASQLTAPPVWVGQATTYIGLYAAVVGGLSATATLVYVILKIRRIVKSPIVVEND